MLWLIWQMWFFLILAFAIGLGLGWRLWSASGEAGKTLQATKDEIARLQRENDSLSSVAARHQAALEASQATSKSAPAQPKFTPKPAPSKSVAKPKSPKTKKVETNDLTQIKGLGPKAVEVLKAGGIISFSQIAGWTKSEIAEWDEKLNARGRIDRENWVGQAKEKLS